MDERGTGPLVWVGDRLVPAARAQVSVFDRGFRTGEGVFETFRAYGSHPFRLEAHLDRAAAGAETLGFTLPDRRLLRRAVTETAVANDVGVDSGLRLTVTPGAVDPTSPFPGVTAGEPTVVVTAQPLAIDPAVYRRGVAAVIVDRSRELPDVKAVSYLAASLARREAHRQGADEALLATADGRVLEGSYSNLFLVTGDLLVTPPLDAGILPGVTRAVTLDLAAAAGLASRERQVTADDLFAADEAFLTATTRELVPLVTVAGHRIGDGRPGPATASLHRAYRQEVSREISQESQ